MFVVICDCCKIQIEEKTFMVVQEAQVGEESWFSAQGSIKKHICLKCYGMPNREKLI